MLIIWVRKNKAEEQSCQQTKDKECIRKHNDDMKKFRITHPKIKTEKPKEAIAAENHLLLPVQGIRLPKHSQN